MQLILNKMIEQIALSPQPLRIGFPDGNDQRILAVIAKLKQLKNVEPIIINEKIMQQYNQKDIIEQFKLARANKKETIADFEKWVKIPNYFAMALLKKGDLDCVVGGAVSTTAELLRPAIQVVGTKGSTMTSFFWMSKNDKNYFLGDCAVVIEPNNEQMVTIGEQIAQSVSHLFNVKPFIAMLSFSTNGSGDPKNESVQKMQQASIALTKKGFNVLGETQFDAAFDAQTRQFKWKKSIAEQPNVYIFPNLNAGNIGYKIMKLTGNYEAIGPIVVGLNKPVNDLSRGANVDEIYNLSIITLKMALGERK